jgi:hypothetical protein
MASHSKTRLLPPGHLAGAMLTAAIVLAIPALARTAPPMQEAAAPATIEDVKPFLGLWTTSFDSPQGRATFDIDINLDSSDPGAIVSNDLLGEATVTDVTKSGAFLILRYAADVQGTEVPVVIALVPDGETLKADFSFMGGEFTASSVATRKK